MTFASELQNHLDRLQASGWTRDEIAAELGYTARQLLNWRSEPPPRALRVGVIVVILSL